MSTKNSKTIRWTRVMGLVTAGAALAGLGSASGAIQAHAESGSDGWDKGVVTTDTLRERVGPSTHVSSIGDLNRGEKVELGCKLPGTTVDGKKAWYRLAGADGGSWVSARYVKLLDDAPRTCERGSAMGTTTAAVNVRQAPTTKDGKLGSIGKGVSTVDVFCKVGGSEIGNNTIWYATAWGDGSQTGYVHSEYVDTRGTVKNCGV